MMTEPDSPLCPVCGAYWRCEHWEEPDALERLRAEMERRELKRWTYVPTLPAYDRYLDPGTRLT